MPYPTQDRIKELLHYCPHTGRFTWIKARGNKASGSPAGYTDPKGYVYIAIDKKDYAAHRLAWIYTHGVEPQDEIDHKNHVKDDNRIDNLRPATHAQNCAHRRIRKDNFVGYKGVQLYRGKYASRITVNGRQRRLGTFNTPEEAYIAYLAAAQDAFGKFHHPG